MAKKAARAWVPPVGKTDAVAANPLLPPPFTSNMRKITRMRRLLTWSPVVTIIAAIFAVSSFALAANPAASPAQDSTIQNQAEGIASDMVESWAESGGLPYGTRLLTLATIASTDDTTDQTDTLTTWTFTWLARTGDTLLDVTVSIRYDPAGETLTPLSSPTVALSPLTLGTETDNPWPTLTSTGCPDSIRGAVESWVAAYLSGDPVNLQQTVGDGNVTHHYTPLAGLAQPQSDGVAVSTCAIPDPKDTGTMIAAVHVTTGWLADGGQTISPDAEFVWDVRIDQAASASPRVTAWGPSPTGPSLTRYRNATNEAVEVATPQPSAWPTPSDPVFPSGDHT